MKNKLSFSKSLVSCILILSLLITNHFGAVAQSPSTRNYLLESDSPVILMVNENFNSSNKADNGIISALVQNDVYSADGTNILIKAGTPATIEFNAEPNGSWGKAGKICMTNAYTKSIDNKKVMLRLSNCQKGGGKIGGVIVLSVLLFPLGLISGCMKGSMPKISKGTTFNASTIQDIYCSSLPE